MVKGKRNKDLAKRSLVALRSTAKKYGLETMEERKVPILRTRLIAAIRAYKESTPKEQRLKREKVKRARRKRNHAE